MGNRRGLLVSMLTALLLAATGGKRVEAQMGLFSAEQENRATRRAVPVIPQVLGPSTIRSRPVRIDLDELAAAQAIVARDVGPPATLTLNLFDDTVVSAVVERTAPTLSGGYSLSGQLTSSAFDTVTVVVNGAVVAGTVRTSGEIYWIRTVGDDLYVVAQVDLSMLPPEVDPLPPPGRFGNVAPDIAGEPRRDADDDSEIDMLIVYTPKARTAAGGPAEMEALIDLLVAETNQIFADSDVSARIRLVHREAVNYTENGDLGLDLQRITDPDDGHMDEVHALRDTYGADLVHLITTGRNFAGIARLMTKVSQDFAPFAFGVTNQRSAGTFTHELGHNLGLRHDRHDDPGNTPYPYSHGYVNQRAFEPGAEPSSRWYTIMALGIQCRPAGFSCSRVHRFSNSRQNWNGDPIGIPGDAPSSRVDGPADAARSLNETWRTSASFRSRATTATASLSPDPSSVVFQPNGAWHGFTVNASEPVDVVANTGGMPLRVSVAGSDVAASAACPPKAAARVRSAGGQAIHLAACSLGTATVQLVRASDGTVLRNYVFEVFDRDVLRVRAKITSWKWL